MTTSTQWRLTPQFQHLDALFGSLDKIFALEGEVITHERISGVIRISHQGRRYYVKRYVSGGKGLRRFLGKPRIQSEWENLLWFAQQGIATAPVVAYGMETQWGLFQRGAMITEEIPVSEDLASLARADDPRLSDAKWVNKISLQAAQMLQKMHKNGFVHNDFKWRNLLVDDQDRLYVIDCPLGAFWRGALLRYRCIKDLAMLDRVAKYKLTRSQRLRFYLQYRGHQQLTDADKYQLQKLLSRKVRRKSSFAPST
ncbi:lipopolysaccharide kinase InaA family protein [Methylophaga sp.]|uniref:lipopolysaccharide kinase InaA family protein n=1 Tax=Methylophaga sp. TaxID=2024840 RepID=UPI00271E2A9F|nr:lipopolysaccharide kinase InaA family protein [Methylophaga sp.]MDO8828024.1 lipopolysaccharide kinase InaA family protein [Methylophaga sp.]